MNDTEIEDSSAGKLLSISIENFRGIEKLDLSFQAHVTNQQLEGEGLLISVTKFNNLSDFINLVLFRTSIFLSSYERFLFFML